MRLAVRLLSLLACAAPCLAQPAAVSARYVPSLEDIFAQPSPMGERPVDARVSADGRWCVFTLPEPVAASRPHSAPASAPATMPASMPASAPASSPASRPAPRRPRWLVRTDGSARQELRLGTRTPDQLAWAPVGHELWLVDQRRLVAMDPEAPERAPRELLVAEHDLTGVQFHPHGAVQCRSGPAWLWWSPALAESGPRVLTSRADAKGLVCTQDGSVAVFRVPDGSLCHKILVARAGQEGEVTLASVATEPALHLSADGRCVVFPRLLAESDGGPHLVPDYLTDRVTTRAARTGTPRDLVPKMELWCLHTESPNEPVRIALPGDERRIAGPLLMGPKGARLLVSMQTADHHHRSLLAVDLPDPSVRVLATETDAAWLGPLARTVLFDQTGEFVLFTSERSGFAHLYRVPWTGGTVQALTQGEHEVTGVAQVGTTGQLLITTSEDSSSERVLRLLAEDGSRNQRLRGPRGWIAAPAIARTGAKVVFQWSDLWRPADLFAADFAGNDQVQLTDTVPAAFRARPWQTPEEVRIRNAADQRDVAAHLFRPQGTPPPRGWPAVMFLHGAGYLQNVMRSMTAYEVNLMFHHRLAERGYVVLSPDFRGSAGYGRQFRADVHHDLGGPERSDLRACKQWLVEHAGVDPDRIGLYGGSYGGFLTLMALFKDPDEYACGAALRPVTDWATYHPGYIQPLLGNLREEPEVYRRTSPIHFAEQLKKPLLLLHGMLDDNVFVQDTVRLVERLITLGKDFDAMLYPSQNHAFSDPASWVDEYRRIERLFDQHLRG